MASEQRVVDEKSDAEVPLAAEVALGVRGRTPCRFERVSRELWVRSPTPKSHTQQRSHSQLVVALDVDLASEQRVVDEDSDAEVALVAEVALAARDRTRCPFGKRAANYG